MTNQKLKEQYFAETGVRWYDSLSNYANWLEDRHIEALQKPPISGSVVLNKHNLKSGDKYRTKSFLGDIIVTDVFESYFKVKMDHVSGTDHRASCTFSDFNNKMIMGEITSLIRA